MPFKEATFWYGTILFTTGIYFWIVGGDRVTVGIILTIVGLVMSLYAVVAERDPSLPKLRAWVALLLLTWAALGYDYYDRHVTVTPAPIFIRSPWRYSAFLLVATAGIAWIVATIVKAASTKASTKLLEPKKLTIRSAFYGTGPLDERDVTEKLSTAVTDALVVPVENNFLGCDPAPHKYKWLRVEYSYGNLSFFSVARGEGSRLVLPEDSEIQRLNTEIAKLKGETSPKGDGQPRNFPRHVFTIQEVSANQPTVDPAIVYKDKIRVILTNHLDIEVEVWIPLRESSEVQCQQPFGSTLQLEGSKGWKAKDWGQEVQSLKVPVGVTFRCWIGLLPPIGQSIQRRLQTRTRIGTAIFPIKVNGKLYEIPIEI